MYNAEKLSKIPFFRDLDMSNVYEEIVDSLTKVISRKHTISYIENLIANKVPFAMGMIDLDNFKLINDNYAIGFGIDKGYKLGLYKLENQVPEKIDQIDGYSSVSVVDNHKALYIEGEVFGFASSKNIITNDGNYYTNDFIYMYEIYTIDYEDETPKLKLIKEFKLNNVYKYEKMIRIGSDYYLISQLNISKLNSDFDIEEVIKYINK